MYYYRLERSEESLFLTNLILKDSSVLHSYLLEIGILILSRCLINLGQKGSFSILKLNSSVGSI